MTTKRLQDVVEMVSSILTDYPVTSYELYEQGIISISTPIWDFYFTKLENTGYYVFDNIIINSGTLDKENEYIKQQIKREISKYGISNSF